MAAVAGLRGTGDWGTDERPKSFREYILWRNPNGGTPITGLLSKAGKEKVTDPEFSWWDEPVDLLRLQVAGALASGDTLVTVDSTDPSVSSPGSNWGIATHLKEGDLLMVEPATAAAETATHAYEYVEVTQVLSATQFVVKRGAAGSTAGAIGNDAWLLHVGSAYAEGTGQPKATSRNPIKYFNYTQIFKNTYEVTRTASQTKARTGDLLKNEKKRKAFDHARGMEFAYLFGERSEVVGDNGKPKRTTRGIRRWIPSATTTIFSATVTTANFLEAVYKVFDFESGAGDERIGICGNLALNSLNQVVQNDTSTTMEMGAVIKQFGMNLREFILPQGRILLRTHPMLNRHTVFSRSMWLLDFSALKRRFMEDTDFQDNIQAKGEDLVRGQWLTEDGLEVESAGLTLGYLGNVNYTP